MRYRCITDENRCDNNNPTNYDNTTTPPCCVHILRDIAQWFDSVMCTMGLEYFSTCGTLLGLERGDRIIPWTSDNDYSMDKRSIVIMKEVWETTRKQLKHGLHLVYHESLFRLCAAPDFADGKLQRWAVKEGEDMHKPYYDVSPYTDIYSFQKNDNNSIRDILGCKFQNKDIFPLERRAFYNGTVYQQVPQNSKAVLNHIYGPGWQTPDLGKSKHGRTRCQDR